MRGAGERERTAVGEARALDERGERERGGEEHEHGQDRGGRRAQRGAERDVDRRGRGHHRGCDGASAGAAPHRTDRDECDNDLDDKPS